MSLCPHFKECPISDETSYTCRRSGGIYYGNGSVCGKYREIEAGHERKRKA